MLVRLRICLEADVQILPKSVQALIDSFSRLPGIGPKTAARLVLYLLHAPNDFSKELGDNILKIKKEVKFCKNCYNLSENEYCTICSDTERDRSVIIVVEDILDLLAFENIGEYKGLYHILGGLISPMNAIGPENLTIDLLMERIRQDNKEIKEIVLATNPSMEGEATAIYISNLINKYLKISVTRIARGLPTGADLDYADKVTLKRAFEGRKEL